MHPPLHRPHPLCDKAVELLEACHSNNPFLKYAGACNDAKATLDACFKLEKESMRKSQHVVQRVDPRVAAMENFSKNNDKEFLAEYEKSKK